MVSVGGCGDGEGGGEPDEEEVDTGISRSNVFYFVLVLLFFALSVFVLGSIHATDTLFVFHLCVSICELLLHSLITPLPEGDSYTASRTQVGTATVSSFLGPSFSALSCFSFYVRTTRLLARSVAPENSTGIYVKEG